MRQFAINEESARELEHMATEVSKASECVNNGIETLAGVVSANYENLGVFAEDIQELIQGARTMAGDLEASGLQISGLLGKEAEAIRSVLGKIEV